MKNSYNYIVACSILLCLLIHLSCLIYMRIDPTYYNKENVKDTILVYNYV